jgi:hypothetical protein
MSGSPEWKRRAAGVCLCTFMIGTLGEKLHLAHPLCDWHRVACEAGSDPQVHTVDSTSTGLASGSGLALPGTGGGPALPGTERLTLTGGAAEPRWGRVSI